MPDNAAPEPPVPADVAADAPPVTSLSSPIALSAAAASRLDRAVTTWTAHLHEQSDTLRGKVARSVTRLTPTADPSPRAAGHRIDDRSLAAFWTWFDHATTIWRTGNAALVATLGNEALGDLRSSLLSGARFDVRPAPLDPTPWAPPPLDAVRPPPLEPLAALRSPWLLAALALALAPPVARAVRPALWNPWTAAAALALALALASLGVARRHRQLLARRHDRAVADLHARLLAQAGARLADIAAEQLAVVRQHLTVTEVRRWEQAVQETRREQLRLDGEEHDPRNRTPAYLRAMQSHAGQAPGATLAALADEPSLFSPTSPPGPLSDSAERGRRGS